MLEVQNYSRMKIELRFPNFEKESFMFDAKNFIILLS